MVSRRGRMLWALAALLVLVGCTPAEGEETPSPTVSESGSESTEPVTDETGDDDASGGEDPSEDPSQPPEVEAPEPPADMDEETVDGAIAAATYFVSLMPYARASGDLAQWDALSDEGCGFCSNFREQVAELHSAGGYAVDVDAEIYAEDGGGPYSGDAYIVELGVRLAASADVQEDGSRTEYDASDYPEFSLSMLWRNGDWVVTGVLTSPEELEES